MIDFKQFLHHAIVKNCARGAAFAVLAVLAGCGGGGTLQTSSPDEVAPIALTPKQGPAESGVLAGAVDETEMRKAIERYRIIKHRAQSPYVSAGADLNGDGVPEAIVLFSGTDWCKATGCSLVVFHKEVTGYKPVSHIISAQAPVQVGPESSFGWHDLIVKTGGGGTNVRSVRLAFTGRGYPRNALLQPEPTHETLAASQQILAGSRLPAATN